MASTSQPDHSAETKQDQDWGEQLFLAGLEFADNPEPRCPCVLLLDTSKSMEGKRIAALNEGLQVFRQGLLNDLLARQRVEIAIVTFGGTAEEVRVVQNFVTVDHFSPPQLEARGATPMGTGILRSLDLIGARKKQYKENGVPYYRPWVFMMTDGSPQGEPREVTHQAVKRVRTEEAAKQFAFFSVGVEGANMKLLGQIGARPPILLRELQFVKMFLWLSRSTGEVARSRGGDEVALPLVDWGTL